MVAHILRLERRERLKEGKVSTEVSSDVTSFDERKDELGSECEKKP